MMNRNSKLPRDSSSWDICKQGVKVNMRIGIDARAIGSYPGIGTYGGQLIKALSEIDQENEYIIFKNSKSDLKLRTNSNFKIIDVDIPLLSIGSLFKFGSIVAEQQIDILHSLCEILPLLGDVRKVITVHDIINIAYPWAFKHQSQMKDYSLRLFFRTIGRYGIKSASSIIAVSNYTKHDLINWMEIPDEKISVIYEAAGDNFRPAKKEDSAHLKAKHALPDRFLFYIGSIKRNKNILRLIRGFANYVERNPKDKATELIIGGFKQFEMSSVKEEINQGGVKERVRFLGYVSDEELPIIYNLATALIYPSTYEGFGLPPLEAMGCHTPVICSNTTSIPEVVGDGALFINPFDPWDIGQKIALLINNTALQKELVEKGIRQHKKFSWISCAQQTLKVYSSAQFSIK